MTEDAAKSLFTTTMARFGTAAQEQDGSRFIQWRLKPNVGTEEERDDIFAAALPTLTTLSNDTFGNFVIQKLIERGTEEQKRGLMDAMNGEIFNLSTHKFGCRVIQKMLEVLPSHLQEELVTELKSSVVELVENMNGNHVVQVIIKVMQPHAVQFVIDALADKSERMASNMFGCRVLQRILERCSADQVDPLVQRILRGMDKLLTDRHANYVVQCILENGQIEHKRRIIQIIINDFLHYAKNKVSSNVVEKAFAESTVGSNAAELEDLRTALYNTVLGTDYDYNPPLRQLATDKFGNYAVQTIIRHSRGNDRAQIKRKLESMEHELQTPTGKHIMAALKKLDGW